MLWAFGRPLLSELLLGTDESPIRSGSDEPAVDSSPRRLRACGKGRTERSFGESTVRVGVDRMEWMGGFGDAWLASGHATRNSTTWCSSTSPGTSAGTYGRSRGTSIRPSSPAAASSSPIFPSLLPQEKRGPSPPGSRAAFSSLRRGDQLLPTQAYVELLTQHGFRDVGFLELTPVHAVTYGRN